MDHFLGGRSEGRGTLIIDIYAVDIIRKAYANLIQLSVIH